MKQLGILENVLELIPREQAGKNRPQNLNFPSLDRNFSVQLLKGFSLTTRVI
jgi:hypothetical protein